jgi:hypothetical protein
VGELRKYLRDQNITAYVPLSPRQKNGLALRQDFEYHEEYLICPEGKKLKRGAFLPQENSFKYRASQRDCRICPRKATCLWPSEKRHCIKMNTYYPEFQQAAELNNTLAYSEEIRKRKTIVEGIFACQDRLGWARCKLHGLWKVDCEGFLAALAHNILKAVRKLKARMGITVWGVSQRIEMERVPT